jgi:hypothetical protein
MIEDIAKMQEDAQKRHQEVLNMIDVISGATSSDKASSVRKFRYLKKTLANLYPD